MTHLYVPHYWVIWHVHMSCTYMTELRAQLIWISVPWLIRAMTHSHVWYDSFTCVLWLMYMWDMTYLNVWHESLIRLTWLVHVCDMAHSHVRQDPLICATWPIHPIRLPHIYGCHTTHMNELCHTYERVMSHIYIYICSVVWHHTHEWAMSHILTSHVPHIYIYI